MIQPDENWILEPRVLRYWLQENTEGDPANRRLAAVLLNVAGQARATIAMRELDPSKVDRATFEMARLDGGIVRSLASEALAEHDRLLTTLPEDSSAGITYAREILESAFGTQTAIDVINRLTNSLRLPLFDYVRMYDPQIVLNFIVREHPQVIALALSHLEVDMAALLLASMDPELQVDGLERIATKRSVSEDVFEEIERAFERMLLNFAKISTETGGMQQASEIAGAVDAESARQIMLRLHPDLAAELVRRLRDPLQELQADVDDEVPGTPGVEGAIADPREVLAPARVDRAPAQRPISNSEIPDDAPRASGRSTDLFDFTRPQRLVAAQKRSLHTMHSIMAAFARPV